MDQITSIHNPKIKHLLQLQQKSSARRKEGLFVERDSVNWSTVSLPDMRWWRLTG